MREQHDGGLLLPCPTEHVVGVERGRALLDEFRDRAARDLVAVEGGIARDDDPAIAQVDQDVWCPAVWPGVATTDTSPHSVRGKMAPNTSCGTDHTVCCRRPSRVSLGRSRTERAAGSLLTVADGVVG